MEVLGKFAVSRGGYRSASPRLWDCFGCCWLLGMAIAIVITIIVVVAVAVIEILIARLIVRVLVIVTAIFGRSRAFREGPVANTPSSRWQTKQIEGVRAFCKVQGLRFKV